MRVLLPCPACGRHVFAHEVDCPFCKASTKRIPTAPALLVGSALMVATAACGGSLDAGPDAAPGDAAFSQPETSPAEASTQDSATADAAGVDSAAVDATSVDSAPDADQQDDRRLPALDAALGLDADEDHILPVTLYRSPPRRSDWS